MISITVLLEFHVLFYVKRSRNKIYIWDMSQDMQAYGRIFANKRKQYNKSLHLIVSEVYLDIKKNKKHIYFKLK